MFAELHDYPQEDRRVAKKPVAIPVKRRQDDLKKSIIQASVAVGVALVMTLIFVVVVILKMYQGA